jgi:hypothetical protein
MQSLSKPGARLRTRVAKSIVWRELRAYRKTDFELHLMRTTTMSAQVVMYLTSQCVSREPERFKHPKSLSLFYCEKE